ncbi:ependymin-like isoform X2 [Sardina pilchardus]|uniref:ependymin-like isoform X2 n=1 Tax=Sardina pilchardus TaxID=27697 RepID=UPI002E0DB0AE
MLALFWITSVMCLAPYCLQAQRPRPCASPPLYMGNLFVSTKEVELWAVANYAYDAFNQRLHLRDTGNFMNKSFSHDVLMLFQEGLRYNINHANQTCVKEALQSDFHPMAVPKSASFLSQVVLGTSSTPGQGLLVNTWWGDVRESEGHYVMSFTELSCLPVSGLFYTEDKRWISVSFYNNFLGIDDPNRFIPPPFCKDAEVERDIHGGVTDFFSILQ